MAMNDEDKTRVCNIDWLEVYCLESNQRYPCNAEYFERAGYSVRQREYGTRVYKEMFEIMDKDGNPLIEIRRNPASGSSDFNGLVEQSTHIRLPNWMLYQKNPIQFLQEFLVKHDYIFKRIYRIDIAYDFELFDSGDSPARFAKRYLAGQYRKINQCFLSAHGNDTWSECKWQSLSWGSKSSMVTTKLYNKTLELAESKNDKPWIKTCWMVNGLIDNPMSMTKRDALGNLYKPEIWRIEFAMMSQADGWLTIEMNHAQKPYKQTIPHKLSLFDSDDKLWQRFQDLAYNYFHFKIKTKKKTRGGVTDNALSKVNSRNDEEWQRKDRCPDKILFYWDKGHKFMKLSAAPAASRPPRDDDSLKRKLILYRMTHADQKIRMACDTLIENIERIASLRFVPLGDSKDRLAIQRTLAAKLNGDQRAVQDILQEMIEILNDKELF